MNEKLSDTGRKAMIDPLLQNGWSMVADRDAITKTYVFEDFPEAFAFMTQAAFFADKWNHHPEWRNVYNKVVVILTTHDVDGLSAQDAKLARKMDGLHPEG